MTRKKSQISKELEMVAEHVIDSPEIFSGAAIFDHLAKMAEGFDEILDLTKLKKQLSDSAEQILKGDYAHIQAVLINQMETLNMLFYEMTAQMGGAKYIAQLKVYGNLALQLQNHTRRTAATLVEIQNPKRTTFVRQANIAHNQQINQVSAPEIPENYLQPEIQVLEANHVERLDDRAQEAAVGVNPQMEALGKVDRAKVPRG